MSFSSEVKEELNMLNTFNKKNLIEAEILGYMLSANSSEIDDKIEFITENEFNIERIYKLLFKLNIEYEPEAKGKVLVAKIKKPKDIKDFMLIEDEEEHKALIRGAFLGSGSINDPNKKYHLEILLKHIDIAKYLQNILNMYTIHAKVLENKSILYIKEGEEISKFLAFIGATQAVLKFEEIRVMKDIKNNVNRVVNCETANLNRTVNAALEQIEAINFLKRIKRFDALSDDLIEVAELRLQNPEVTLKELGQMLEKPIGKSGVNHRLKKILEIVEEIKRGK